MVYESLFNVLISKYLFLDHMMFIQLYPCDAYKCVLVLCEKNFHSKHKKHKVNYTHNTIIIDINSILYVEKAVIKIILAI